MPQTPVTINITFAHQQSGIGIPSNVNITTTSDSFNDWVHLISINTDLAYGIKINPNEMPVLKFRFNGLYQADPAISISAQNPLIDLSKFTPVTYLTIRVPDATFKQLHAKHPELIPPASSAASAAANPAASAAANPAASAAANPAASAAASPAASAAASPAAVTLSKLSLPLKPPVPNSAKTKVADQPKSAEHSAKGSGNAGALSKLSLHTAPNPGAQKVDGPKVTPPTKENYISGFTARTKGVSIKP